MRLLFVSDNFPPEVNAPATRTYEHCKEWVKAGVDVTVITCTPNFPQGKVYKGYENKLVSHEVVDGIKVVRVWSYISSNEGFVKRTLDYVSFSITAFLAGLTIKTDVIMATSPQFFAAIAGRWLAFFKRKPWVMEVRDMWPESIKTVGAMEGGKVFDYLEWLELRLYKSARLIVPVTDSFKENMISRGIDGSKIKVVKNGANLSLYRNQPVQSELLEELGFTDKFIIGYIGTHGMAHKLDFILNCASKITDNKIQFLFIGSGAKKPELINQAETMALKNVLFLDSVVKSEVWKYISILDAMVVPLKRSDLFKTVIPSKIFETAAMKTPILLGVDGEVRKLVETYGAGLYFEPENEKEFLRSVDLVRPKGRLYSDLKEGCERLAQDFDRKKLAAQLLSEIECLNS
ncbi:glycosyltransferase family 4 protein [Roseivirga sp. E12]|uniref:glycosyltransferase family 4 protein n=1 Tax=Roseivirga sp. E12 TaxID=2819237 RepID=UPI001ABD2257|nr:glycosyltransferase family 4 protein [Roseivirga sp. E12]